MPKIHMKSTFEEMMCPTCMLFAKDITRKESTFQMLNNWEYKMKLLNSNSRINKIKIIEILITNMQIVNLQGNNWIKVASLIIDIYLYITLDS